MEKKILIAVPTFENIKPECFKSIYGLTRPEGYVLYFDYVSGYDCAKARNQIAKIFDKKEKTVAPKVQKSKLEKYESDNVKLLKNYGLMNPDAIKPRPFYDLRQMLEGPAQYYFKQIDDLDLIDVIIRVAIGKHREWIHNRSIDK